MYACKQTFSTINFLKLFAFSCLLLYVCTYSIKKRFFQTKLFPTKIGFGDNYGRQENVAN